VRTLRDAFPDLRRPEILFRVVADYVIVQGAAIVSLTAVLLWRLLDTPGIDGAQLAVALERIYLTRYLPQSLIFPVVFALSGFYSFARAYQPKHKWRRIAAGSATGTLLYLLTDFLTTRADVTPRSSTLLFLILVPAGTVAVRALKYRFMDRSDATGARSPSLPGQDAPVLIAGGAGYIGSILCRQLLARGYRVRVLDKMVYGDSPIRELLRHDRFELLTGDCRSIQSVVSAVKGVNAIIHLAAIVGDPACEQDRQTALEVNYAATRMLTEIARGNGVARLIFASSCSVYGATGEVMDELSVVRPISLYAQTKVDSEHALLAAASASFHPTVLRLATVFGHSHRPRFDLVVNLLAAKAHRDGVITIFNGRQWRPFIHARDVARGIIQVLEAPVAVVSGEVFNLGDARLNCTLGDLGETIRAAFPHTRVEHIDNADRRNYCVSFDKIRQRLGFECGVTIEEGIAELRLALETGAVGDFTSEAYHNQRFLLSAGSPANQSEIDAQIMAAFSGPVRQVAAHT
jgi:nucleoside-diphosphate-sugar epimerase